MKTEHRMGLRRELAVVLVLGATQVTVGCEDEAATMTSSGTTASSDGIGGAGTPISSSTTSGEGGAPTVPPECISPSGYQICGGPKLCPYDESACPRCHDYSSPGAPDLTFLAYCENDVYAQHFAGKEPIEYICGYCTDGDACVAANTSVAALGCTPFEIALLFDANGGADRLRYADHSQWTGDPLPEPADCPNLPGVPLCGGACGPCASPSEICAGRSPLHPYGLCVPALANDYHSCSPDTGGVLVGPCEAPDTGCFMWKVQPDFQGEASSFGYCLPLATCKAAAEGIPGGGICLEPPP